MRTARSDATDMLDQGHGTSSPQRYLVALTPNGQTHGFVVILSALGLRTKFYFFCYKAHGTHAQKTFSRSLSTTFLPVFRFPGFTLFNFHSPCLLPLPLRLAPKSPAPSTTKTSTTGRLASTTSSPVPA